MNKNEFLKNLRSELKSFSKEDIDDICSYYSDLIEDKKENEHLSEEEVINSLGDIKTIVKRAHLELISQKKTNKMSNGQIILLILSILFASPILFPLGIVVVVLYFVLCVVWLSLSFSFGVASIACFVSAFVAFASGYSFIVNLTLFGLCLISASLMGALTVLVGKYGWKLIKLVPVEIAKLINRKDK